MKITSNLYEAYLKCPTKCWLISQGDIAFGNTYAEWVRIQNESYKSECVTRMLDDFPQNKCTVALPEPVIFASAKCRLAVDILVQAHSLESRLHAVERVQFGDEGGRDQFIPICFIFTNKITQDDKLRVAFDALILSETLGREVGLGKIIHGESHITTKVKTAILMDKVMKQIKDAVTLLGEHSPPDLVLKRYCAECEFQVNCRQMAIEKDDLSLLVSMTRNERNQHRSKGIFTVNQLSYTFRPRRIPKRAKNPTNKHYPALQALAIRENTVFIHGSHNYTESKTLVYWDIEGLPDHDSYYLIGALVVSDGHQKFHSFWANDESEEPVIFSRFTETVAAMQDFTMFCYGDYEKLALRKMKLRLPETFHKSIDEILNHSVNVLSLVHSHFYFPSYSNGLKDIGKLLGYDWYHPAVTGLNTIIWRTAWNQCKDQEAKNKLTIYNEDDCKALKLLCDFISRSNDPDKLSDNDLPKACHTQRMLMKRPYWQLFDPKTYAIDDFKHISKCAYFDYQREKVLIRTEPHIKALKKKTKKQQRRSSRSNKVVYYELKKCIHCKSRKIEKLREISHTIVDLKFNKTGPRKCITRSVSWKYVCNKCHEHFNSEQTRPRHKYGHGLACWCVYLNNVCGVNQGTIATTFGDVFGLSLPEHPLRWAKQYITNQYQQLYNEILQSILSGPVIHIDETTVSLAKHTQHNYVWVLTSMDKVYYFYRPTRVTSFLKEMLATFNGVLVSDFYTGYDSLPCEQQKCIVHIVRDIDDDVLRNPFDNELKVMAQEFGVVLRSIVSTIDKYGLKRRHLQKHKKEAFQFLTQLSSVHYSSEIAIKYQKRFEKSGKKMFTFLDHDGVPWNNNNAEHAIKRIAKHRRNAGGRYTEHSLEEYLVMASVFETCKFNNINILQFLLSKVNTLDGLLQMAKRKSRQSVPILADLM